ncbi:putative C-type cyclin [Tieghemostelium lacteum]|uniref:Putative C-type cyclin n=1 Tax=Tieghemostelium lacteum TaxID=361077 RepID=A0A151Z8U0_TIELA|nr:putative C-type cyclin [Tieghemostelium lacteum]|eukprot:KYQ90358.1 putative C-type cyclin [Tieghemostelium lacteum]
MAANFWESTHCHSWLLDRKKIEESNAKDKQYLTPIELKRLKIHFCNVIQNLGYNLKLRQRAISTAIVYFKRFYLKNSFVDCEPRLIAVTCLYLSSKVEECITQAKKCVMKMKELDNSFNYTMNDILECEFYVLEELDFCLVIYHPYKALSQYLASSGIDAANIDIVWGIVNDSYRTDVSLIYPPFIIALGCIYLSSFIILKKKDLKQWFSELNVDMKDVWEVSKELIDFYDFEKIALTPHEVPEVIYSKLPIRNKK